MKTLLHFQADSIEVVLAQHRLAARVTGGTVTPSTVRFQVSPAPGTRLRRLMELSEELALSLGVPNCRLFRQDGCLHLEIPRQEQAVVRLPTLCDELPEVPPCCPVLGLDHDGCPLLLDLVSPDVAHVLVAGTTGSGKTELARAMIASLVRFNRQSYLQLVLIDPKNRGFASFQGLPHLLRPVITEPGQALETLVDLVAEMVRRDRERRDLPRIVVFIDELADLAVVSPKEVHSLLTRLAQRGRQAGIHLVACTQKPTADLVSTLFKANFPVRLVGAVPTPEDAKVATGLARTGAERLLGRGDFLAVSRGRITRFQAAFISEGEIRILMTRIRSNVGATSVRASTIIGGTADSSRYPVPYLQCVK